MHAHPPGERLHALDSLRAVAMLLGIVLHAAASLATFPFPWPVHDVSRSAGFDTLMGFIHLFRMQLFFFIAGFFAHLLFQRLGTREFLRQRGRRIGIPFLAGLVVLIPLIGQLWLWADSRTGSTFASRQQEQLSFLTYPTGHLWFLQMLLILYLLAAVLARLPGAAAVLPGIDAAFDRLMRLRAKPLLLMVPTAALLWMGPYFPEIDNPGQRFLPGVQAVAYYALFFGVGWWLHRRSHLIDGMRTSVWLYVALAFVAFIAVGGAMQASATPGAAKHAMTIKLVGVAAASLYAWSMTFAVTGLFLRFAGGHRPWVRYVADASYWWYLWHLPIVILLQIWIAGWAINGWLKLALMLAVTVAVLLPSYHWMVRYTWVGRLLNGERARA
ncbi:MAG: acyltransferase family protein [Burkholderiales bacterium]|nr:acyltransferase family protein [Burkholderiales bacterium]